MSFADLIKNNKEKILSDWMKSLKKEMPVINKYDKTAIENSVPDLLNAIIENLKSDDHTNVDRSSKEHGNQRATFRNYSLRHIIREYNLLKAEIMSLLDAYEITSPKDRDAIMLVIDKAIEQAADVFFIVKQGVHVNAKELAEKKANELELEDDNREEFIQSISHDLNSPLNNIKACIDLLEQDLDIQDISQILKILKTSTTQAEMLIKDFLDVGKIGNNNKLPVHITTFDIIEELENEIKVYEVSQNMKIDFIAEEKKLAVNLDLSLFRRVFNNLMNNALKHGNSKGKITVSCLKQEEKLIIEVQNYGKVIPKDALETIFNRYYQIEGKKNGWGIGLAFVKEVLKAHKGDVKVSSSEEKGTTFKLIFSSNLQVVS